MPDFTCPTCENVYDTIAEAACCCHGPDCDCDDCQMERAEDTERERYEDDGREYGHPGDFMKGWE